MPSYITPAGLRRLQEEADRLWRVERPRVTREVSEAAALGDRSENAEYIYGKRRLREIDRRLRFLQKRMDELTVVRSPPEQRETLFFGAWVASMVGSAVPNSRLKQFAQVIEEGKILVMADVPQHRVNEVREQLNARHPEAEDRGIDPHIPAFP